MYKNKAYNSVNDDKQTPYSAIPVKKGNRAQSPRLTLLITALCLSSTGNRSPGLSGRCFLASLYIFMFTL